MFEGHDPYLVALSVVIAILGGYTGFGLAARIRAMPGVSHRVLLASAAGFLAIGIWTMHFIGMLAIPTPSNTADEATRNSDGSPMLTKNSDMPTTSAQIRNEMMVGSTR